jgi:hypothetical protein
MHLIKPFFPRIIYKGSITYIELDGCITQNIDMVIRYIKEDEFVHEGIEYLAGLYPI